MKLSKKLVNQYNNPDSLLVITSYPQAGQKYAQNQDAVASFAKNRIYALKSQITGKTIVLADFDIKPSVSEEDNVLVIRCFKKDRPATLTHLLKNAGRFNLVKSILVEFEFAMFGGVRITAIMPLIFSLLRLMGKRVIIELHQVLHDLSLLSGHIGQKKGSLKNRFFSAGLNAFYFALGLIADELIVLEPALKEQLEKITGRNNVAVIPHGVDRLKSVSPSQARLELRIVTDQFAILSFGFITWYKGSDFLVKTFANSKPLKNKDIMLILAGGPSFNQKNKMIIIHETFICKPGQASKLAKMFKEILDLDDNNKVISILTDLVGDFNKVVLVSHYESLTDYERNWEEEMKNAKKMKEMEKIMKDYHDTFLTGKREIYRVW